MLTKLLKPFSNNVATFVLIFTGVLTLLGIGFISGWKAENIALVHSGEHISNSESAGKNSAAIHSQLSFEEVILSEAFQLNLLIGLTTTILLSWTLILLIKSKKDKREIENINKELKEEISKRQNATSELHVTHQQLSTTSGYLDGIIHGTTDLIAAVDKNYKFISFNESFKQNIKELFGTDIEIGMAIDEALASYPDKLEESKHLWNRALDGEKFSANQVFNEDFDSALYYELAYTPIQNKNGEIIGASQICRDVTQRRMTAEKLKQERDFASAIFDVNSSLVIVLDREGRVIRFNKACEKLSGYKEDEVKGRILWNILIPTEDVNKVKQSYQKIDTNQFSKTHINQWVTKDEITKLISWQVSAIKDENGSNEYIVATGIDITEKREFETAQRRMLEILENSTDFIRISDLQGQVIYLNPAGRKMLGLQEDSDISMLRIHSCHPKQANDLMQSKGYPTAVKEGTWLGETAIKTLDNREIPTSQLILAHRNSEGDLEYFSTVVRDISQLKLLEEDYAKARDAALETTRMKSEFLANMSHEIRTPMNGVIGIAELLLGTKLTDEQKDYAETIQNSGESLLTIINDILDFSKLEAGKLEFENVDFDLHKTIESIADLFARNVSQKKIDLCLLIQHDVPTALRGDPGRLRQVITNLISNAIKFTETGEIILRVKLEKDGINPTLHFSVKDSGIGIKEEVRQNLFNAFTQADTSITRRFGGTGLGLAISKQLVSRMNGEIGVISELNEGSTFWFTATFDKQVTEIVSPVQNNNLRNKSILIVDDNQAQRNVLLYQAKSCGMLADETGSTYQALEILKKAAKDGEPFQIVLADINMSEHSGLDLAKMIRNDPVLRDTKIILMPSIDDREQILKAKKLGFETLVTKPIKQTALFNTLNHMLSENPEIEKKSDDYINFDEELINNKLIVNNGASTMNTTFDKNARILIAEDNLVNQKVILNQVTGLGYDVDLVENGQEVLDALQLKDYSLILMDCQMPIMDGFDATINIRENEKITSQHIPIIAVTAHAIEGDRERCLAIGMDDYISKPTKQQVLANAISFWLNKSTQEIISKKKFIEPPVEVQAQQVKSEAEAIETRLNELKDTCGNEIVVECINLFLSDTANLLDELNMSMKLSDFEKIAIDGHKLKGSAANMGARRLPRICQKLIEFSRSNQNISSQIILKQLSEEYDFLKTIYLEKREIYEKSYEKVLTYR